MESTVNISHPPEVDLLNSLVVLDLRRGALREDLTVLHNGQVLAEGSPAEIQGNERVQEIYFGRGG